MKPTKEEMKAEAIRRLKAYGVCDSVIRDFDKEGVVYYSERLNARFPAVLYFLEDRPDLLAKAKEIEADTGCMVYHVIVTHLVDGEMVDFLLISKYKSDWEYEDTKAGYQYSYCMSPYTYGECESGTIVIQQKIGGLARVA